MNIDKIKTCYIISFIISLISLIIGASFHEYRIHPENVEKYNLGVTMGIIMISIFIVFIIIGIILLIIYRKKVKYENSI